MTDQLADLFTPDPDPTPAAVATLDAAIAERDQLRRALADVLRHVEDGTPAPGNRIRAWRELAGTEYVDGLEPFERGMEGSTRAAAKWTDEEVAKVDEVIKGLAEGRYYPTPPDGIEFTTADVWAILGEGFPVTKGIAGRMAAAKGAGLIESTGRTTYPPVNAPGPNNGQRLTVWRSTTERATHP